jgi:hypothetical protein
MVAMYRGFDFNRVNRFLRRSEVQNTSEWISGNWFITYHPVIVVAERIHPDTVKVNVTASLMFLAPGKQSVFPSKYSGPIECCQARSQSGALSSESTP